jgi:ribosome biogenesis GTPase A
VAFFALDYIMREYPSLLETRFKQDSLPASELELLEIIGSQRGCLRLGGQIDLERAATVFINELRAGILGEVSYETPDMIDAELSEEF